MIPHAYKETASYIRTQVDIRYAFYVEHNRPRGTFSDFKIIEALTPRRIGDAAGPAASWNNYDESSLLERITELNTQLEGKTAPVVDLMNTL